MYQIVHADVLKWAETYDGPSFHALLCDPPYELNFMGRSWDCSGIAFRPDTWKALAQHLLPGAFGMAFASSRGWHRLACAIEDAGLIMHSSIFLWTYGSGFPKATRIKGSDDFSGHRYGLQALKPAAEPIILFQKPYQGRSVDSIVRHGAGALWIDGGRLPTYEDQGRPRGTFPHSDDAWGNGHLSRTEGHPAGRWPPNFALVHDSRCVHVGERQVKASGVSRSFHNAYSGDSTTGFLRGVSHPGNQHDDGHGKETIAAYDCHESCPVRALDAQAGVRKTGIRTKAYPRTGGWKNTSKIIAAGGYEDGGNASRFFHSSDWSFEVAEQLAQANPVYYAAKASKRERSAGLPEGQRNPHPCVKPLGLLVWLCRLLAVPAAYAPRRLLIPFAGVGSECIAASCLSESWEEVIGIEVDPEYVEIANQRLAFWSSREVSSTR
jgi:hypothetical protein